MVTFAIAKDATHRRRTNGGRRYACDLHTCRVVWARSTIWLLPCGRFLAGLCIFVLTLHVLPSVAGGEILTDQLRWSAGWQADAPLHAIHFLDRARGWAVGSRGVLLKTVDGGVNWESVSLPIAATVTSVDFVDDQRGWVATAEQLPYSRTTLGTVWRTADGGKTWTPNQSQRLPGITRVCFLDARRGLATVMAGGMYAAGLIASTDGGRTWSELPLVGGDTLKSPLSQWCGLARNLAGSLVACTTAGHLVIWDGSSARVLKQSIRGEGSATAAIAFEAMAVSQAERVLGVAGGTLYQRGLVESHHWSSLRSGATAIEDAPAVMATYGKSIWLSGQQRGTIRHSHDEGKTWVEDPLPIQTPLRDLVFVDERAGWGVGVGGTILATLDGGKTWTVQRGGSDRVAIYCVAIDYHDLPWELLSEWAGRECYRVHVAVLGLPTPSGIARNVVLERQLEETLIGLGCQSVSLHCDFPLPPAAASHQPTEIERNWRERHQQTGKTPMGMARLDGLLQAEFAAYRPAVILVMGNEHDQELTALDRGDDRVSYVYSGPTELLRDAVGSAISEHLRGGGSVAEGANADLTPAVLQLTPATSDSALRMRLDALLTKRPTTVRDAARAAAANVSATPQFADRFWGARHESPSGIVSTVRSLESLVPPRADMRRTMVGDAVSESLTARDDDPLARQRQTIGAMFRNVAADQHAVNAGWKSQLQQMVLDSSREVERRLVLETAQQLWLAARFEDAQPLFQKLVDSSATHGICDAVMQSVLRRETSAELAYLRSLQDQVLAKDKPVPAADITRVAYAEDEVAKAWHVVAEQTLPDLQFDSRWQMAMASIERTRGDSSAAEARYRRVQQLVSSSRAQRRYATAELALIAGEVPDASMSICWNTAAIPPHLDGQLDEPTWQFPPSYHDPVQAVSLWLAGDQEYLYVACRATGRFASELGESGEQESQSKSQQIPPRDDHFVSDDRVRLRVDTNRDYVSGWELTFGASGRVADACDGVLPWNPKFYRAVGRDEQGWTVEVALPWKSLVAERHDGTVWLLDVQRFVPGACDREEESQVADTWLYFYRQDR